jgi:hypothetical protein
LVLGITGCAGYDIDETIPESGVTNTQQLETISLQDYALPIAWQVEPSELDAFDLSWNPSFGRLEIRKGKEIDFFVVQDTLTCAAKAIEIESGIFEIEYTEKTDRMLIYKAMLPGGGAEYWHFFASFELGGERYIFENNPLVEVEEKQISAMVAHVKNFSSM